MHEQTRNYNKEMETIKKREMKISERKSMLSEMKNSFDWLTSTLDTAEERTSEPED